MLYKERPTAAELAEIGLTLEDFAADFEADVWPDNMLAAKVFEWLGSQWNVGPGGVVGLRYEAFPEARLRFGIAADAWPDVCDGIQIMESAAREVMRKP